MDKETVEMDNPAYAQQDPHLHFEDDDESNLQPSMRNKYPNRPPLFDSMLNNVRAITRKVEHIKGFKFDLSTPLSNNFHLLNSWTIPHGKPSEKPMNPMQMAMKPPAVAHYTLGAQYVGGELRTPFDRPKYLMTGRWDTTGKLEAGLIKQWNEYVNIRGTAFFMNSDPNNAQLHLDIDITGDDYVHTVKLGSGLMSFNMMQTIKNRLVLGFEIMNLTERKQTIMSYAGRWIYDKKHTFYGQYIGVADQFIFAYQHKLLDKAFLVSELNYNGQSGETQSIIGLRQKFLTTEIIATLTSLGKLSTSLTMNGMTYQLKLCSIVDYFKDSFKFGYGIAFGQVG